MLTGYHQLILEGEPSLYIDVAHYSNESYLLNVRTSNLSISAIQITRILIDVDQMNATIDGP